ncbi:MAG TPA: glycosyltransferase [Actinomycetota bacterium]|nr:glycosyltransferase [Actinomycetota bacterium]
MLLVSQPTSYGVAVHVRHLAEAAVAAGHRVTVACPERGPLAGWVRAAGAGHERLDMVRGPSPRDLVHLLALRRLARGRDVVHLHSSKAAALGRAAVATLRPPRPATVVTPHYWSWLVGGRLAGLYRWIERVLAPRCDAIVAVSEREAADGRAVLGSAAGRITVIHNGVDRARFTPRGPRADRDPDAPLVVCVGRLCEQKGQDVAVRALALLRDRRARLRLVGGEAMPGERARLEALAEALGVGGRIEWRGEVDDPAPELRAADVVVAPSRWEGMSLVFLEAMACGAAVVVSDVAGSEVVDGAGLVVPPDDPPALAAAVDALLADPERRAELGARARERTARHDLETALRRNLELWAALAPTPDRPGVVAYG